MTLGALIGSTVIIGASVATAGALPLGVAAGVAGAEAVGASVGVLAGGTAAAAAGGAAAATGAAGIGAVATGSSVVAATATAGSLSGGAVAGGLAGAVGGPIGVLFFCFDSDTMVMKSNGESLKVKELALGDEILTQENCGRVLFTKVTNATVLNGTFDAHKFFLADGKSITVTSPHLMFIIKEGEMVAIKAKDVQTHDIMPLEGGKLAKVVEIQNVKLSTKVNIETAAGTLFANGIFVTGFCENSPSIGSSNANGFIEEYQSTHVY